MIKADSLYDGHLVDIDGSDEELARDFISIILSLRNNFPDEFLLIMVLQCLKISKDSIPKIKIDMSKIQRKG
jgi:hypothetical protein